MQRCSFRVLIALFAAGSIVAGAEAAQAGLATKYIHMDAFKQTFQVLTSDAYARYYPSALGGKSPNVPPIRSYGGCTVLKLRAGTRLREVTYFSQGNSGFSFAFLQEHRYGELYALANDMQNYPAAGSNEKTLHALTDSPIPIRKGYRYYICVEGAPGTSPGDYNEFRGFRIRFVKP